MTSTKWAWIPRDHSRLPWPGPPIDGPPYTTDPGQPEPPPCTPDPDKPEPPPCALKILASLNHLPVLQMLASALQILVSLNDLPVLRSWPA